MSKAIKVQNLSKAYQLGDFGTGTISRDLERFFARIRGKDDPFLKIGEINDRTTKGNSDIVWSLNDLNFEVDQGEAIGIIGRNGAGKSTLLKILSRVTSPTTGSVKIKGRIASLLEVGTGFHPELTGKENIYLNGAILGMRKAEIKRKFDQIVDFAGVERYIDTPVKRYSSGMYVRLAFAVAAHLESEIMIIDEVLAVGDAEFQKKCLGKMGDVSKSEGRTILFVSHHIASIQRLCSQSIFLETGQLILKGPTNQVVESYLRNDRPNRQFLQQKDLSHKIVYLQYANILPEQSKDQLTILIGLFCNQESVNNVAIDFRLKTRTMDNVGFGSLGTLRRENSLFLKQGASEFVIKMSTDLLATGEYCLSIDITNPGVEYFDRQEDCIFFEITSFKSHYSSYLDLRWNYGAHLLKVELVNSQVHP
jgi:lipopolysaccharide transport system ATP-binding protein